MTDGLRIYIRRCDRHRNRRSAENIIALGAGISDGMGYGDNAKAALMTRGLTEIARLGVEMGAERSTLWDSPESGGSHRHLHQHAQQKPPLRHYDRRRSEAGGSDEKGRNGGGRDVYQKPLMNWRNLTVWKCLLQNRFIA